jgi:hypothetical protein
VYRVAVMQADPMRQLATLMSNTPIADSVADSASGLTYKPIAGNPINRTFKVEKAMLCHVGPDAGWRVLRPFLEATQQKLSVAMYDFNADYVAQAERDARNSSVR